MTEYSALVALFPYAAQAESAITSLRHLGFNTNDISVFGRMCAGDEDVIGLCISGGHFVACGGSVMFWERLLESLGDGGFFIVPGIGPIAIAGGFVNDFVAAVDNHATCGALTTLGEAICGLGIAKENVLRYEIEIRGNECALVALGSREQVKLAKTALYFLGISDLATGTHGRERGARQALQKVS